MIFLYVQEINTRQHETKLFWSVLAYLFMLFPSNEPTAVTSSRLPREALQGLNGESYQAEVWASASPWHKIHDTHPAGSRCFSGHVAKAHTAFPATKKTRKGKGAKRSTSQSLFCLCFSDALSVHRVMPPLESYLFSSPSS